MPRKKNTTITLTMNDAASEWTAQADEAPDLVVHHMLPSVCINTLSDALREHYANPELEISYVVVLCPRHQRMLDALKSNEEALEGLRIAVDRGYQELATALTQVRLKQHDIADLLGVSQSHINRLIKMTATGTASKTSALSTQDGGSRRRKP